LQIIVSNILAITKTGLVWFMRRHSMISEMDL
jgi:hypothetical protein